MVAALFLILGALSPKRAVADTLPLVVIAPAAAPSGILALMITGDGGWAQVDRAIAARLSADGDAVVGLNSLHYFARRRRSSDVADVLTQVAHDNCERFHCRRVVLIGYSMGADVLPFVIDQIAPDVRAKLGQIDLISLGHYAVFRFLPTQWIGLLVGQKFPIGPELAKLKDYDVVCFYGIKDADEACRELGNSDRVAIVPLASGHTMHNVAQILAEDVAMHVDRLRR